MVVLPVLFVLVTLWTYRSDAHGAQDVYVRTVAFVAGASLVTFGAVRIWARSAVRWTPWLGMAVVLGVFALPHVARVAHPVRRGAPFIAVEEPFSQGRLDPTRWEVTADPGGGEVSAERNHARLAARPGARASIELRLPAASWWTRPPAAWLLPVRFSAQSYAEQLEWRATVVRTGTFFVVLETSGLLVQAVPSGLHLTVRGAGATTAAEITTPLLEGTAERTWRVQWADGVTSLELEGTRLWERGGTAPLGAPRFGETRPDPQHGGVMTLSHVRYARWWRPVTSHE